MIFYFLSPFFLQGPLSELFTDVCKTGDTNVFVRHFAPMIVQFIFAYFLTQIRVFSRTKCFFCALTKIPCISDVPRRRFFLWNVPYFSPPHRPCRPTKMGPKPWFRHCGVHLEFALKLAPDPPPPLRPPFRSHSLLFGYFPISNFLNNFSEFLIRFVHNGYPPRSCNLSPHIKSLCSSTIQHNPIQPH